MNQSEIRDIITRHLESGMPFDYMVEEQLRQFDELATSVLAYLVRNGTDDEKLFCLVALRSIEPRERDIVPDLITLLDEERVLSLTAAETLGFFGSLAVDAMPWLERQLNSGDDFARCLCAGALLKINARHKRALDVLRAALEGGDECQRRSATHYLCEAGLL